MKENICTAAGVIGGFFAALLGGWDSALITLVLFMAIDFTTGLIAASMGRSKHSKTGRLSSKAGWVGLAKKFCILLMVVVAVRMDILIGTTYIRDATCIGFCVNELLSIIENTSLMGIPYPPAIKKAIEVLQKRAQHIDDDIQEMIDNMEDDKKRNISIPILRKSPRISMQKNSVANAARCMRSVSPTNWWISWRNYTPHSTALKSL